MPVLMLAADTAPLVAFVAGTDYLAAVAGRYQHLPRRIRRVLAAYPWRRYGCRVESHERGRFHRLVLIGDDGRDIGSFHGFHRR